MLKLRNRYLAVMSLSALLIAAGCGNQNNNAGNAAQAALPSDSPAAAATAAPEAGRLDIKASFYPMYEFTKNIVGDLADVELLVPAGTEPHDWEPSAQDMAKITDADVLVYNGAGMEAWVEQVVEGTSGSKLVAVEASKELDIISETEAHAAEAEAHTHEGNETHSEEAHDHAHAEEAHDHDHDHEHDHAAEEEHGHDHEEGEHGHDHDHGGIDPHVWLAPSLAVKEVRNIEAALSAVSPENAAAFKANADAYAAKLEQLDQDYKTGLQNVKRKDFITQHAAFGYLAREYGLTQVPIAGLSPEQEPAAAQMAEIVDFAKEHQVKTIFFETLASSSVAETIAREIGAKTAVLNPIEGLTEEELSSKLDYIGVMRQNLEALQAALNE